MVIMLYPPKKGKLFSLYFGIYKTVALAGVAQWIEREL